MHLHAWLYGEMLILPAFEWWRIVWRREGLTKGGGRGLIIMICPSFGFEFGSWTVDWFGDQLISLNILFINSCIDCFFRPFLSFIISSNSIKQPNRSTRCRRSIMAFFHMFLRVFVSSVRAYSWVIISHWRSSQPSSSPLASDFVLLRPRLIPSRLHPFIRLSLSYIPRAISMLPNHVSS